MHRWAGDPGVWGIGYHTVTFFPLWENRGKKEGKSELPANLSKRENMEKRGKIPHSKREISHSQFPLSFPTQIFNFQEGNLSFPTQIFPLGEEGKSEWEKRGKVVGKRGKKMEKEGKRGKKMENRVGKNWLFSPGVSGKNVPV